MRINDWTQFIRSVAEGGLSSCFDYRLKNSGNIVVVRTEVARETARDGKSANEPYERVAAGRGRIREEETGAEARGFRAGACD